MVLLLSKRRNVKDTKKKSAGYILSFEVMEELPIRSPMAGKSMGLAVKKAVPPPAPPKMDSRQNHEVEDLSVLPLFLEAAGGELQRLCISRCLFIL